MGVTKQAARKRFIPKAVGSPGDADADDGFARFTQRARHVVVAAHNEAVSAGSAEIPSAHLVLGLLTEPEAIAAIGRAHVRNTGANTHLVRRRLLEKKKQH